MKVNQLESETGIGHHIFFCPGCKCCHFFNIAAPGIKWTWNGDKEKPTVKPSIITWLDRERKKPCHSFITDGKIQFLSDCWHDLKNTTVELPDL